MIFNKLFKRNVNKTINQWEIIVEGNSYYTRYGQVGGLITESNRVFTKGKNIGKVNETTPEMQAIKTAKSIWDKKIKSHNFVENIEDVDKIKFNPPMLAKVFSGNYTEDLKFCQPKLDGIRCNVSYDNGKIVAISRENSKFFTVKHIISSLEKVLMENPSIHLDGELYNHSLHDNFNKVVSLVTTEKVTNENIEEIEKYVRYNVYDMWDDNRPNLTFRERNEIINKLFSGLDYIDIVETHEISNLDDIEKYFNQFTSVGYEGLIIRKDDIYEHKRSKNLLKYKKFNEEEFKICDICEGKIPGKAEYAWVDLNNGNYCKATIAMSDSECSEILNNKDKFIGKLATVKFFGYTIDGRLRFPIFKCVRNYE